MINTLVQFADSSDASGLGAFNVNVKEFLFQLTTFVIVLLVLKRWVFPKLVATLEARRATLEESLVAAKKTTEALAKAEEKSEEILRGAREQADQVIAEAGVSASELISKAEAAAEVQANRVIAEAEAQLTVERDKLRNELKNELGDLVIATTQKVLGTKLNSALDAELVERAVKELK